MVSPATKYSAQEVLNRLFDENTNSLNTLGGNGLQIAPYDYLSVAYPDTVTEVYTYKTGGSGGTTVATLTTVYTSSSKEVLSSVTKI
jgi:hypothetical protein